MERQEWKVIEGYDGKYEISNDSLVKSHAFKGRIIKQYINVYGYPFVVLWKNNKRKTHKVHRLVAKAFIPNPENKPYVDHINRIRHDNRLENLRWATHSENMINTGMRKNNTSGLKNICKVKCGFLIKIKRNKLCYSKCCKTEEEAIAQKSLMLSMWI
jgi:hypothetical protein